jgi:hypothetical protein
LDDFKDIEIDTTQKMADLKETAAKAQAIIDLLKEIDKETITLKNGGTITLGTLFENLGNVEKNGGNVREYLEGLGVDVDYVIQKYNVWKESTRQLTSLIPSLSSAIDSETGAINGGTDALQRNLDEWKAAEEKKLAWAAYYAKARALEEKKAELWLYDFEATIARKKAERAREALANKYGIGFDDQGNVSGDDLWANTPLSMGAKFDEWSADVQHYNLLLGEQKDAEKELERQTEAVGEATDDLSIINEELTDRFGELEQAEEYAADAAEEWGEETKKAGKEAATAAESALKALADYVQGVKDGTAQAVNSILKGFEKVNKAGDENRKKSNELATQETEVLNKYAAVWAKHGSDNASLKKMAENWSKLSDDERKAYEELVKVRNAQKEVNDALNQYKPEGMKAGLQSQIDYMEEYLSNLRKAQEMGLSNELLASLSDGSQESAEYLAGLVEAGPEAAQEVDELYQQLQEQKKGFTDALAEQKLAADQTYDALVEKALQTVDDLNLGEEAESAMGDTVSGLAQGIADHVGEVQAAVDAIEEQLNRLSAFGFSFNLDEGGWSFSLDGEHENGLDYVPFDGYLAGLHEGEGILTAEENRIWQRFKNGQATTGNVDYDALGGVMRDNVHAGGDVYLDGRTVGQVISAAQGRSYRALQRSGWQG